MFYDPTPPLSSSWSEWTDRFNMPSHYDDDDWLRPLGGQNRSSSNPRLRRFDIVDDSPRMSRTNSRSDVDMQSEGDDSAEAETSNCRPPRVHRIPIFVEERQSSQESTESPDILADANELKKEWESIHSNTVPRFRRNRDLGSEDDLQRSRSHTSAFHRPRARNNSEQQEEPRRRRPNVTTVKVNCDREQPKDDTKNEPKNEQLSVIEGVVKEVEGLKKQVENISGKQSKHCRYLDEMLTRCMLKLDNVDTMGEEEIRLARKNAICNVQCCIDSLESKIHPPVTKDENVNKSSPESADKGVIVLPFYNGESRELGTPNGGQENVETNKKVIVLPYNNDNKSPEKTVIVLPYHDTEKDSTTGVVAVTKPKSPEERKVIVLPYHETPPKNGTEITTTPGQKSPEKTVIVLPYGKKDSGKSIIPLPYYDTFETDNNNNDDESVLCTKL